MAVEDEDAAHERLDEVIEFGFGESPVDPSVPLRRVGIEVVRAECDLDRPGAPDQKRKALERPAARNEAERDFWLAEDRVFPTREADVTRKGELTSAPTRSSTNDRDAERV